MKIKIGITMGDPSCIGAEIIRKALASGEIKDMDILVIGDRWVFERNPTYLRWVPRVTRNQKFEFIDLKNVPKKNFRFGKILPEYGKASLEYIDKAIRLIKEGRIEALVTCPVSKEAINLAGIKFEGHTEYLAKFFGIKEFAMMLIADNLKVTLVTRHLPLKEVPSKINKKAIYKAIILTHRYFTKFFRIIEPKICVCALNPHAGEGGIMGDEEEEIISPAIDLAKKKVKNLFGPIPADSAFYSVYRGIYDALICMYHDQALIPLRMVLREKCVNLTLGLPFIRTSPCHGTAFDIAGKNKANPSSLLGAIKLANQCSTKKD